MLWSYQGLTGLKVMETTRLSSKGQIILPKSVRDARQWKPGAVEAVKEGVLLRPLKPFPRTKLEDVSGFLKYKGGVLAVDSSRTTNPARRPALSL